MRIIGLDLGEKRIGVAAADDRTQVAVPLTALAAGDDPAAAISDLLAEQMADEVVIGLPLSMSGAVGPQAEQALRLVEELRRRLTMPIHTWDERLTTVQANRSATPSRRGRRSEEDKGRRDAVAAAILLQAFLDGRRSVRA